MQFCTTTPNDGDLALRADGSYARQSAPPLTSVGQSTTSPPHGRGWPTNDPTGSGRHRPSALAGAIVPGLVADLADVEELAVFPLALSPLEGKANPLAIRGLPAAFLVVPLI